MFDKCGYKSVCSSAPASSPSAPPRRPGLLLGPCLVLVGGRPGPLRSVCVCSPDDDPWRVYDSCPYVLSRAVIVLVICVFFFLSFSGLLLFFFLPLLSCVSAPGPFFSCRCLLAFRVVWILLQLVLSHASSPPPAARAAACAAAGVVVHLLLVALFVSGYAVGLFGVRF